VSGRRLPAWVVAPALLAGCAGAYRLDDRHPLDTPAEDVLQLRWHRQLARRGVFDYRPQEWASAAVTSDGLLFVGSSARRFVALDGNGRLRWALRTEGAVSSRPLVLPQWGLVCFGADDGKLYAVETATGKVRWTYATQGTISNVPVLAEETLLFTSSEDRIYAVDAATGRWRWQYDREAPEGFTIQGHAGVAVRGQRAYAGFSDGVLVALRASTGEVVWTRRLAEDKPRFVDVDATPVIAGDLLLTASYASGVYAIAIDNGSVHWHFPVEGVSALAVAPSGMIFASAAEVGLVALDQRGREIWRQAMPRGVPSAPVITGEYLVVTGTETGLHVASARTGRLLQLFDPGQGISAPPTAAGGMLYVLSNVGRLFAFALR
jgi:outer membrane protein assembly factor BamB